MSTSEIAIEVDSESIEDTDDYNSSTFGVGFKLGNLIIQPSVARNKDGEQSYFIMAGIKI